MPSRNHVFIVDDDAAARDSLRAVASSMGLDVRCFETAERFLESAESGEVQGCLVLDIRLPGMSGLELLEKLPACDAFVATIIVTAFAETELTVRAIRGGAVTVLEKPLREQELSSNIHLALEAIDRQVKVHAQMKEVRGRLDSLSDEERQILEMLMAGKPNKAMASQLNLSTRTIENRRRQLYDKMQVYSVPELVRSVVELSAHEKSQRRSSRSPGQGPV